MAKISIPVSKRPTTIEVELGGEEYLCRPLKQVTVMALAGQLSGIQEDPSIAAKMTNTLVKLMFVKEDAEKVSARLKDPEDGLDFPQLIELMNAIVEDQTGNPTM